MLQAFVEDHYKCEGVKLFWRYIACLWTWLHITVSVQLYAHKTRHKIGHYGYRILTLGTKATKNEISGNFVHYCVLIHSQMPSVLCSESVGGTTGGSSVCDRSCSGTVLRCIVRRVTTTRVILILTFPVFQWLYLAKVGCFYFLFFSALLLWCATLQLHRRALHTWLRS